MDCIFCDIVERKMSSTVAYEDEKTLAFMDIYPANRGHTLVIPKAHFRTLFDLDEEELTGVMLTALRVSRAIKRALQPDGLNLFQANERVAFQTVFHFHLHLIPRWKGDGLVQPWKPKEGNLSDLEALAAKIRGAI